MRISDWSSDVCSSDLLRQSVGLLRRLQGPLRHCVQAARRRRLSRPSRQRKIWCTMMHDPIADWLFHPLPADSFLADFWAKEHHVVRRDDPGYFADLFSAKALEEFLEYGRPDPAGVRLEIGRASCREEVCQEG